MRANAPVSRGVAVVGAVLLAGGIVAASACALDTNGLGAIFATDGSVDTTGFGDGCPPDTRSDPRNCGACGHACPAQIHQLPTCTNATCGVACAEGFSDCNANPGDGCEVATGTDDTNCGACGRSCGGGACNGGLCQPTTLASGQQHPVGIAIDDQFVFWTVRGNADNSGELMRAKLDGTSPTVMAAGLGAPAQVVVDATTIYFATEGTSAAGQHDGTVQWIGKDGTCRGMVPCPFVVASAQNDPFAVALPPDSSRIAVTIRGASYVGWVRPDGLSNLGYPTIATSPFAVAVGDDGAYVTCEGVGPRDGTLNRIGLDGGARTILAADAGAPLGVALDDTTAYVALSGDGVVGAVGRDGGSLAALASGQDHPAYLALDGDTVYFTAQGTSGMSNGVVAKVRKDGTCPPAWGAACPAVIASGQGLPGALAVDGRYVYWVNGEAGTVLKVVK